MFFQSLENYDRAWDSPLGNDAGADAELRIESGPLEGDAPILDDVIADGPRFCDGIDRDAGFVQCFDFERGQQPPQGLTVQSTIGVASDGDGGTAMVVSATAATLGATQGFFVVQAPAFARRATLSFRLRYDVTSTSPTVNETWLTIGHGEEKLSTYFDKQSGRVMFLQGDRDDAGAFHGTPLGGVAIDETIWHRYEVRASFEDKRVTWTVDGVPVVAGASLTTMSVSSRTTDFYVGIDYCYNLAAPQKYFIDDVMVLATY